MDVAPPPVDRSEPTSDAERLIEDAVAQVERWLDRADELETARMRTTMARLRGVVVDDAGVAFVMAFIDRVARPDDDAVAARQLRALVDDTDRLPAFLGTVDRMLLRVGARIAPVAPALVMPIARRRMRGIVGHLVAPAESTGLAAHLGRQRRNGWASNVNLLGEAVLGRREAAARWDALAGLLAQPDVDYVSVKLSSVAAQLNPWAHEASLDLVSDRLADLVDTAAAADPPTFVNVDMEEYHDLELTLDAFERVLGSATRRHLDAGIVLQAYLPDALPALQRLTAFATERHRTGGGEVKVRLVKGANLAMERVDAAVHGWTQAPYDTKAETDANYVRCLDWVMQPERLDGLRIGIASHNLFHLAWAMQLGETRGVSDRIQFEMLQGMAEAQAGAVAADAAGAVRPLLYTPAVHRDDFDVAIGYLFRRLEETAAPENFLRALFDLAPGTPDFAAEAERFAASVRDRSAPSIGPRRTQDRREAPHRAFEPGHRFRNEPETDPSLMANRQWLTGVASTTPHRRRAEALTDPSAVDRLAAEARRAATRWLALAPAQRREQLHRIGDQLADRREVLMRTMADECGKTLAEADVELCEAIDFARYYGERCVELDRRGAWFEPFGLVSVVPPWNFPVAIPAGGVLAALAAGNAVLFKPAPEAVRCAELIHDAVEAAGLPDGLVAFAPASDDEAGRRVVETADAVILTGSSETADLFRSWDPAMRLFAETSGKNALVITPNADVDLAVEDLVRSAFGHAGQKCSAASLAILVGGVGRTARFRRQLVDAVETLEVRPADDPEANVGPLIGPPNDRLERALHRLDEGESWLVEPRHLGDDLWRPGVREGVAAGSWFHRTECFGPVLGLIEVDTLDEAIDLQNGSDFGLTGGIHTLDPREIERWTGAVEVGNAYVNRPITGAIVQRQPFGGWKRSSVGPGAKAGGPNYVAQLGTWHPRGDRADDYAEVWREHVSIEHDPTALEREHNVFRYRPLPRIVVRHGPSTSTEDLQRVRRAATVAGVEVVESDAADETDDRLAERLPDLGVERIRLVGHPASDPLRQAAIRCGVHLADQPVVAEGRVELLHCVREQALSTTNHRFGNPLPDHRSVRS
ncbi:MAG: bifunctional proline dehydrogenase/L-glutamate gamma-semialdehyde dehydrogenase [Actinomycetota bacterium]